MRQRIGHYKIIDELGRGGMGVVYKGYDETLKRHVAIKVLSEELTRDETFTTRFIREAQSAASLNHPNITRIYFIGEDAGCHYFVMEFVRGRSLSQLISAEGRLDNVRAAQIILQSGAGLAMAHNHGVVHRDIKPANLMLTDDGVIKIADFGLAFMPTEATRLTNTGMLMGTPGYLSPEQCMGTELDGRTDIYSLGVTFYEMLSGTMPFQADSPLALVRKVCDVMPTEVTRINPRVHPRLATILRKMMVKDREDRYQSCHDLVSDINGYLESAGERRPSGAVGAVTARPAATPPSTPPAALPTDPTEPVTIATVPGGPPPPPVADGDGDDMPTVALNTAEQQLAVAPTAIPTTPAAAATEPGVIAGEVIESATAALPAPAATRRRTLPIAAVIVALALGAAAMFALTRLGNDDKAGGANQVSTLAGLTAEAGQTSASSATVEAPVAASQTGDQLGDARPVAGDGTHALPTAAGTTATNTTPSVTTAAGTVAAGTTASAATALPPTETSAAAPTAVVAQQRAPAPSLPAPAPRATAPPPRPLPATPRVAVVIQGDPLLADAAEGYLERELSRPGIFVVDENNSPWLRDLELRIGNRTGLSQLADFLSEYGVSIVVLGEAEPLADRELYFGGRLTTATTARLRVNAFLVDVLDPVGPGWDDRLEYTQLNVEDKAGGVIDGFVEDMADSLQLGWSQYRASR